MTHSRERRVRWSNLYNFTCDLHLHGHHGTSPSIGTEGYSRVVYCNRPDKQAVRYPSNYVSTTKYNLITFFPKALFEQFRRVANIYFLITAALSVTPLSPFSAASMISPLVFVIGVSMAKEALEDWQRFLQDLEVNNRKVLVHQQDGKFEPLGWKKLKVGHIVKVEKDSFFPADLLLLSSSYEDGICYVETMNLDGETNLKLKRSLECTMNLQEDPQFATFSAEVYCEDPNPELYSFVGTLKLSNDSSSSEPSVYPLGPQQILLRDSKLRNTNFIYGAVIFSGPDTKVMQNATPPPSKRSRIEKRMDLIIYLLFVVLFLMSAFGSVIFGIITWRQTPLWWYLRPDDTTIYYNPRRPVVAALLHLVTALIMYGYLIPISLYVSIEIVKVAQAMFINQDIEMYDEESDTPARARTSNLNEELGQVDTILSDKTGTLTCNVMEFVKCSIAGVSYGHGVTEVEIAAAQRQGKNVTSEEEIETTGAVVEDNKPHVKGFNLKDERLMNYNWVHQENVSEIQLFFRTLAVCNTVVPDEDEETGEIKYEAESPDESAFVVAARELGFELCKRTQSSVMVKELDLATGQRIEREYRILELLEFSSARKRMSVVVKDEEENLYLFCKGADSVIFERLGQDGRKYEKETREHIAYYAEAGLRTMAVAYRSLDAAEYESWSKEFAKIKIYVGPDRDLKLDEAAELIEKDLILLGATAVEDKLQKGVPQCIDKLARAGIKIWVLTGDKLETAINIGFACSLLRQDMIQLIISLDNDKVKKAETSGDKECVNKVSQESIKEQIGSCKEQFESQKDNQAFALIIEGRALTYVLGKADETDLMQLAIKCSSVICCRVSPKQKAMITRLVKKTTGSITLGIGDGANDVGMIQEAHVGVGISGHEGMQATMASDFSIAQFRFLERLLLVHGSWCYKRLAHMICYFFYKNIHFGFSLFYYEAYAAFSGQAAYDDWYLSLFNVFFTSLPVIAYGIFEQDVSAEMKLEFPHLYQQGIHNLHFSWARILGWMANAVGSSLIVFFFTINIIKKQAFRKGGQVSGLEVLGTTLYTCVVWTVNCQLVLFTKYFTWIQHLCIWGSIALWFIFVIIYGYLPPLISTIAYRVFIEACAPSPMYWLIILLVTMAALVPSLVYKSFQNTFCPTDDQIIHEIHYLRKDKDQHWLHKVMENPTIKVLVGESVRRLQAKALTSKEPSQEAESSGKVTAV